jgi:hypothetical protein
LEWVITTPIVAREPAPEKTSGSWLFMANRVDEKKDDCRMLMIDS